MDPYDREERRSGSEFGQQLLNLGNSFVTYLKTRQPEHWLFLAVGIIIGLWLS